VTGETAMRRQRSTTQNRISSRAHIGRWIEAQASQRPDSIKRANRVIRGICFIVFRILSERDRRPLTERVHGIAR
jgi:hypothetical protein